MKNNKERIENLYFQEKKSLKDIAKEIGISISYVSRILKTNENYIIEKNSRKSMNLVQRRKKQKELIYAQRKNKMDSDYAVLRKQHDEAIKEFSRTSRIGNIAIRKWCSSAYKYNNIKNRYEFDCNSLLKPTDFPKFIRV